MTPCVQATRQKHDARASAQRVLHASLCSLILTNRGLAYGSPCSSTLSVRTAAVTAETGRGTLAADSGELMIGSQSTSGSSREVVLALLQAVQRTLERSAPPLAVHIAVFSHRRDVLLQFPATPALHAWPAVCGP